MAVVVIVSEVRPFCGFFFLAAACALLVGTACTAAAECGFHIYIGIGAH